MIGTTPEGGVIEPVIYTVRHPVLQETGDDRWLACLYLEGDDADLIA